MSFFHNTQQSHIQNLSNYSHNHHHHHHHHHYRQNQNNAVLVDTTPTIHKFRHQNKAIQKCESGTKRKRNESKEGDKSEEVIQVRAKRGQATDSHSLAERVRRKKINERLKCLQTLVPGCYETMGMAVMLDAVISYVQSLQNQIEFLSMKLSAASMHYDFHTPNTNIINPTQAINTIHHVVQEIDEKIEREGFGGCFHNFH